MSEAETARVLSAPMGENDADAATVREYLIALLAALWAEGEGFSGKRPLGNSGWEWDVYAALVRAGLVVGSFDADGYLDDLSDEQRRRADTLVTAAITSLAAS